MKFTLKKRWTEDRAEDAIGEIVDAFGPVTVLLMLADVIDSHVPRVDNGEHATVQPRVLGIVAEAAFAAGRVLAALLPAQEQDSALRAIDAVREDFYRGHGEEPS